jgi:hypothetical protein
MEESEFLKLCAEAIDEGRAQTDNAMYMQKKPTKNNELNTAKMDTPKIWRKAPPKGKDPAVYAKECRECAEQLDSDGNCGFCGRLGHSAKDCLHLAANTPRTWKPVWGLWCYCRAKGRSSTPSRNTESAEETSGSVNLAKDDTTRTTKVDTGGSKENDDTANPTHDDEGNERYIGSTSFAGSAIENQSPSRPWIADSGAGHTICGDIGSMIEYIPYRTGDTRYSYSTSGGTSATAKGFGYALIRCELDNGRHNDIITKAYYNPDVDVNLYSTERAKSEDGIWHHQKKNQLLSMDSDDIIGYTYSDGGVAWIKTCPPKKIPVAMVSISPEVLHRRYAHAGKSLSQLATLTVGGLLRRAMYMIDES